MRIYYVLTAGLLLISLTNGFNIETQYPSIKIGGQNSGFGFSVACHAMKLDKNGIIVGAPFEDKSGSIYWCPYISSQCQRVNFNIYKSAPYSYTGLQNEMFGYSLSTLPNNTNTLAVACAPRLSYQLTGKLFVTGGCFTFDNFLSQAKFLGASTCLNIPEASRSLDLRFCLDGASSAYYHNANVEIILSGSPYYRFARGIGLVNNVSEFNPVRKTHTETVGDYSLLGSSSAVSDRVFSTLADTKRPIVTASGAPGVPQTKGKSGSGFVLLSLLDENTNQLMIPQAQLIQGNRFGSRFGHAVAFIDLNGDGWDDLLVGAPFEQIVTNNEAVQRDKEGCGMFCEPTFGNVYVYWNQKRRLPSTTPYSVADFQIIRPPSTLSFKSGFGNAITNLGDIDHDGINDFAVGAPYNEGGGVVVVYRGSKSREIGDPAQILNSSLLPGFMKGFGFSLASGGLDLDRNGYPDLAVGAPDSNRVAIFRTRPVIKVEVFMVREEDGSNHMEKRLDSLEDCTRETHVMSGYWAPRVHCLNLKVLATFTPVDPVPCAHRTLPVRLLLTISPPEHWLSERFTNITKNPSVCPDVPVASFIGERVLRVGDPEIRAFYRRSSGGDSTPIPPSADSDEALPFLVLQGGQEAICRDHWMAGKQPTPAELARAHTVRLAFRDVDMVDLTSPLRFGVKWLLEVTSPQSSTADLTQFPINNPKDNTAELNLTFSNECEIKDCSPVLLPRFDYFISKDKDGPVVYVGDDESQTIEVRVTLANQGSDPSYAAGVYTSYPEELLDLNASVRVANQRVTLVRPGLALCHFGNPLPPKREATCVVKFNVLGQQLMKAPKNFSLNSTIATSPKFPPKALTPLSDSITVKVKMSVNVSISGEILPDAAYYSGNVTDGVLINHGENKIGSTRLLVRIRVQNLRKHSLVPNSQLVIDWPYETADTVSEDHGKFMFYLLEKPYVSKMDLPSTSNTTITCDSRALEKLVNPYNYRVFKSLMPQPRGEPVSTSPIDLPLNHPADYPPLKSALETEKMPDQGNVKRVRTTLSCYNGQLRCAPIVCDLGPLSYRAGVITLEMPARLWDNTMRQDFKHIFLTSVQMTATWRASVSFTIDAGDKEYAAANFELKVFNDMESEPVYPKNMPLYIGLAVFAGLLLLAILIIVLWKAKFFERKKLKERFQKTKQKPEVVEREQQPLTAPEPVPPPRHSSLRSPPITAYGNSHG